MSSTGPGRAAVERALERAERRHHRGDGVRPRRGHDARREGRSVHAVLGDGHQVGVEAAHERRRRGRARQHAQQVVRVAAPGVGRHGRGAEAAPVPGGEPHRDRAGEPAARALERLVCGAQAGEAGAQRVHRVLGLERRRRCGRARAKATRRGPPRARSGSTPCAPAPAARHPTAGRTSPRSAAPARSSIDVPAHHQPPAARRPPARAASRPPPRLRGRAGRARLRSWHVLLAGRA